MTAILSGFWPFVGTIILIVVVSVCVCCSAQYIADSIYASKRNHL